MTCADLDELVWLAVDDELPAEERRALDTHLAGCADCRRKAAAARKISGSLARLQAPSAPERFKETLLARVDEAPARVRILRSTRVLAAAAVLLLLAGIWFGGRLRQEAAQVEELASAPAAAAPAEPPSARQREAAPPSSGLKTLAESAPSRDEKLGADAAKLEDAADAFDEGRLTAAAEPEERRSSRPSPAGERIEAAGSVAAALQELLDELDRRPRRPDDSRRDVGPVESDAATSDKADRRDGDDREAPRRVEYLVVSRDGAAAQEWLAARDGAASEQGLAVVDVTPAELAQLRQALAGGAKRLESLEAEAWLDRVARSRPRPALGKASRGAQPDAAPARKAGEAKEAARSPAPAAGVVPRVRVVLWLEAPAAPAGERR